MAGFSPLKIQAKAYALLTAGYNYDQRFKPVMFLTKEPDDHYHQHNAFEFGLSVMRSCFATHAQARNHMKDLQYGRAKLNEFRKIDPATIRIHELTYEAFAVDFDDNDYEAMTIIGAFDSMEWDDRQTIKSVFDVLGTIQIAEPEKPACQVRPGHFPRIFDSRYVRVNDAMREKFNMYATNPEHGLSAVEIHNAISPGSYYNTGLNGVTEDIGKTRLGLDRHPHEENYNDVLFLRVYDPLNLEKLSPPITQQDRIHAALNALSRQQPSVVRTILEALRARGFDYIPPQPMAPEVKLLP